MPENDDDVLVEDSKELEREEMKELKELEGLHDVVQINFAHVSCRELQSQRLCYLQTTAKKRSDGYY
jgi:hypothetical protein